MIVVPRAATGLVAGVAALHLVPSVAAAAGVRRFLPALSGDSRTDHVALTFDDGPDPSSTPAFLDLLAAQQVRATFFVLGSQLAAHPDLGRRIAAEGHEVAVHGWAHRPHLLRGPVATAADIRRAHARVCDVIGRRPRFWRPPHGIATGAGLLAALSLRMRPVLWTADGRDWSPTATGASVRAHIEPRLHGGAVLLLHDSDITSAPSAWESALDALPGLIRACADRGLRLGPLGEHGLVGIGGPASGGRASHATV